MEKNANNFRNELKDQTIRTPPKSTTQGWR